MSCSARGQQSYVVVRTVRKATCFQGESVILSSAKLFSTVIAIILCNAVVQAGTIVTSDLTNSESQIINTGGALVSAGDFGAGAGTLDINGIAHTINSNSVTGLTVNEVFEGDFRNGQATAAGYTGDMLTLMEGIAGNNFSSGAGPISLDISGLTIGTQYLFQGYWEANNFGQTASVTFEGADTQGGITGNGTLGVLISYTFTAGDTVLDADLTKTGGSDNIWWQGYSLQELPVASTPEPGTFVLATMGLVGLVLNRRRRRRR